MKKEYIKPTLELIELNVEGVIATSSSASIGVNDDEYTGPSFSKKKFWDTKE